MLLRLASEFAKLHCRPEPTAAPDLHTPPAQGILGISSHARTIFVHDT